MQFFSDGHRRFLAQSPAIFVAHVLGVSLDFVRLANRVKRLLRQLVFIGYMQAANFAVRMGRASDFGDAQLEAGLVARKAVTDQLAAPGT
jgi:predicted alpha/beta hydrolase family esterase